MLAVLNLFCRACTQPDQPLLSSPGRSQVWVVLVELVEMVSVPGGNTETTEDGKPAECATKRAERSPRTEKLTFWHRKRCSLCRCSRSTQSCTTPETRPQVSSLGRGGTSEGGRLDADVPGTPNSAGTGCRRRQRSSPPCWRESPDPETQGGQEGEGRTD